MKESEEKMEYKVVINGTPDYSKIPKEMLGPVLKKFLENLLKEINEKKE